MKNKKIIDSGQKKYLLEEAKFQLRRYENSSDNLAIENIRGQIASLEIIAMAEAELFPEKENIITIKKIEALHTILEENDKADRHTKKYDN